MTAPAVFDEPRGTLARQLRVVAGVLLLGIAALAPTSARAECARSYTQGELMQDTQSMTAALRALDEAAFRQSGARMEQNLACMRTKLRPQMQASSYRYVGAYHFLNGDFETAAGWFRVALEVEPGFEWDLNELALDHPMRRAFDAERPASAESPTAVVGKELLLPAGSKLLLDGRVLSEPKAALHRPHMLQVLGGDGTVRQVFIIQGNEIPEQFLTSAGAVVADAGGGSDDEYAVQTIKRVRPRAKTPLMISGGAVALGAAGIYGASFATRAKFDSASTSDELAKYRSLTNTLVVVSGVTLAVGVGVEYAAIVLDGSPGLLIRRRF